MKIGIHFAAVTAGLAFAASAIAQGPSGVYYMTAGDQGNIWRAQGNATLNSWTMNHGGEYPIAVTSSVRTLGVSTGGQGSDYSLTGTFTGTSYTNNASGNFYDGASNGTSNFALDYANGTVYQFSSTWTGGTALFTGLGGSNYLGITYDFLNNSLWISRWNSNVIEDRTMAGALLSSFTNPLGSISSLAMDYSDNTLWFGSQSTEGTFYHYSRSGSFLGQVTYQNMLAQNTLGGEFQAVPEPASLLVLSGAALLMRRRRRANLARRTNCEGAPKCSLVSFVDRAKSLKARAN